MMMTSRPNPSFQAPISHDLANYKWQFQFDKSDSNSIGIVTLSPKGGMNIRAGPGCNVVSGDWSLGDEPNTINVGAIMTTMMVPPGPIWARERFLIQVFSPMEPFGILRYDLDMNNTDRPLLTIYTKQAPPDSTNEDGKIVFFGKATDEFKYNSEPERAFFDVYQTTEYPSGWKVRTVTYLDENYVKSENGEWEEYSIAKNNDGKLNIANWTPDDRHNYRIRTNQFKKGDGSIDTVFDMTVMTETIQK